MISFLKNVGIVMCEWLAWLCTNTAMSNAYTIYSTKFTLLATGWAELEIRIAF